MGSVVRPAPGVVPAAGAQGARWLAERMLESSGATRLVGSITPTGFEAYVRILHPAIKWEGPDRTLRRVRWADVAASVGGAVHPEVQWQSLIQRSQATDGPPPWTEEPSLGGMDRQTASALVDVLQGHTATPNDCWLAVWTGWGGWDDFAPRAPIIELQGRTYMLLRAPIAAIAKGIVAGSAGGSVGPSLWWPDDVAWCVATDIDFVWTYVSSSRECAANIRDHPQLEAVSVRPEHRCDVDSDSIN